MDSRNSNPTKKKRTKMMEWLKKSIISKNHNNKNKNKHITTDQPPTHSSIPPTLNCKPSLHSFNSFTKNLKITHKKPRLKFSKSADDKEESTKHEVKTTTPHSNHQKCLTEMNKSHPCLSWHKINHASNCDTNLMAFEAANQCQSTHECVPCKRISFILSNLSITSDIDISDNELSLFMSELEGYSHIGLTKDFRHLQVYHTIQHSQINHENNKNTSTYTVDYSDTRSLLKYIYNSLSRFDLHMNMNKASPPPPTIKSKIKSKTTHNDVLQAVSTYMMELSTKKDFNNKYMKLGLISKGANGKIYAVKSWHSHAFYAMKEICFKHLNINILYEILRNWRMVQRLGLLGPDGVEIFVDSHKSLFLIVSHLYKGSMCELLKETYINKKRCMNEIELKLLLKNGVVNTLETMHENGYIHGDIKPENLVYEYSEVDKEYKTGVIDYDLCTRYERDAVLSEWRGTLGYSAPEWSPYKGIKSLITPKVDIYSLGLTMLILLCGEQPFLCPTAVKLKLEKEDPSINIKQFVYQTMINNGQFMIAHFLSELAPKISADLTDLLRWMLENNVHQRADICDVVSHAWFS